MLKARPSHCLRLCDWKGQQRAVGWPGLSSPTCTSLRPFSLSSGPSSVQLDDVAQLCHRPPMGMTRNWYETRRILETERVNSKITRRLQYELGHRTPGTHLSSNSENRTALFGSHSPSHGGFSAGQLCKGCRRPTLGSVSHMRLRFHW